MIVEQLPIERVGVVVVGGRPYLDRLVEFVDVIGVEPNQRDLVTADGVGETFRDRGFPELLPPATPMR